MFSAVAPQLSSSPDQNRPNINLSLSSVGGQPHLYQSSKKIYLMCVSDLR